MTAASLLVNGVDVGILGTGAAQWDATWEERVDGVGNASVTIQDRDNLPNLEYGRGFEVTELDGSVTIGWRDLIQIKVGSLNLFHGEITKSNLDLPAGFPFRRWKVTANDFNSVMDMRLVGAPDGYTWETIDGGETYTPIDPDAHGLSSDADTVAALFDAYARKPLDDAGAFDTSTFVHDWIPASIMVDPNTGESRLRWTNTTLRSALDEMRALAGFPLFCWIDPDDAVHWMALPAWSFISGGGLPLLSPMPAFTTDAPAIITDTAPNGTTSVGGRELSIEYDSTYMPQEVYVTGVTDFLYNGGSTYFQGTGWSFNAHNNVYFRQVAVDAQAVTNAEREAVSHAYINYARRPRIRGSVKVGRPDEAVDGWRCGQLLTIVDARLPAFLTGKAFPIQRVSGSLKAGHEYREYTLEFGDFPLARFSQKYRSTPQRMTSARLPTHEHTIHLPSAVLLPSHTYTVYSQMVDHSKKPVRKSGVPVLWGLTVTDASDATVGTGTITAINTPCVTDNHGRTAATLVTGATVGLHYHLTATTVPQ
jgi:hypothetical protein